MRTKADTFSQAPGLALLIQNSERSAVLSSTVLTVENSHYTSQNLPDRSTQETGSFGLMRMTLSPNRFHDQTDQCIRNGIRH